MDQNSFEADRKELRELCGHMHEVYLKSKKESQEWKNLSCFTAGVLKGEIVRHQSLDRAMKEQVERLVKENSELKNMCIVLDKKQEGVLPLELPESTLTPPETAAAVVYANIMGEVGNSSSEHQPLIPSQFSSGQVPGRNDRLAIERGAYSEFSKERALVKMKERLETVEGEKVELIKSLSAAHMLMADEFKSRGGPADDVPMPQALRSQWERAKTLKKCQDDGASVEQTSEMERAVLSPDTVMETVTLLDIVRRLEAAMTRGFSDAEDEAEALALRQLVNIAWQKIQESAKQQRKAGGAQGVAAC